MINYNSTWNASPRPQGYRTPSPPPWSPILSSNDGVLPGQNSTTRYGDRGEQRWPLDDAQKLHKFSPSSSAHRHRSSASMEAFATIALATQPMQPLSRTKRASDSSFQASRPKRARVEYGPQHESAILDSRPATSYQQPRVTRVEDAELLLFFSQHNEKAKGVSPKNSPPEVQHLDQSKETGNTPLHKFYSKDSYTLGSTLDVSKDHNSSIPASDGGGFERDDSIVRLIDSELNGSPDVPPTLVSTDKAIPEQQPKTSQPNQPQVATLEQPAPPRNDCESALQNRLNGSSVPQQGLGKTRTGDSVPDEAHASVELGSIGLDSQRGTEKLYIASRSNSTEAKAPSHHQDWRTNIASATVVAANTGYGATQPDHMNTDHTHEAIDLEPSGFGGSHTAKVPIRTDQEMLAEPAKGQPAGLDLAPVGPQEQAAASSAVCAACRFSKNSLGLDTDLNATSWINCDGCKAWFHFACAGFKNEREVRSVDKFRCKKCRPVHGATSYVRKSMRAHSAIDYAGLHQGVIKTSDDKPEHHYIRPIREGEISFLPENFARMRPELVTAEFFERADGMKEPVIIPSYLNPQTDEIPEPISVSLPSSAGDNDPEALDAQSSRGLDKQRTQDDGQDGLGMVMPRGLTVRKVADLYGPEEKIEVIDVKSQNGEGKKWNMRRWVDYYESTSQSKVIRNVISLEFSQSKLGRLVRRPQLVRDLDLQDAVWPSELSLKGDYPHVQFYCLMSVADCFTDFHIDFGGSSVFYHILKGKKTFLFIPPKEKHLKKYEEWCRSPAQNWTFLPDQTKECYRVDLSEGDTMLIPSGWIHAVWTPEDSLVIGGNFLTRLNYGMQFRVVQVEKNTGVARKFRYPQFQKIQWLAVLKYLEEDAVPVQVTEQLISGISFHRDHSVSDLFDEWGENSKPGPENFHCRYYPQPELDGLPELLRYVLRTALIDNGTIVEGITAETRNAVKKSIPRGHGEPMDVVKKFAIWVAWKRGNELIPYWAYPEAVIEAPASDKHSAAVAKRLAEEAASKAPRRQSQRVQIQREQQVPPAQETFMSTDDAEPAPTASPAADRKDSAPLDDIASNTETTPIARTGRNSVTVNTHRKTACDSCRRRRRACKHKDVTYSPNLNGQSDFPQPKVSRTEAFLNGNALQEKLSSISGLFNSLASKADGVQSQALGSVAGTEEPHSPVGVDGLSGDYSIPLNNHGMGPVAPTSQDGDLSLASDGNSPPRPRAKACNHCRKSKRRCIHDAFGKEDPIKIAESAVPRPHARKTTRYEPPISKEATAVFGQTQKSAPVATMVAESDLLPLHQHPPTDIAMNEVQEYGIHAIMEGAQDPLDETQKASQVQDHTEQGTDSAVTSQHVEVEKKAMQQAEKLCDPASSFLASPPASSHSQDRGQSSPGPLETPLKSRQGSVDSSSHAQELFRRHTPESGTPRDSSGDWTQAGEGQTSPPSKKERRSIPSQVADEESLRLIKELQAQDLGLRRRGKG